MAQQNQRTPGAGGYIRPLLFVVIILLVIGGGTWLFRRGADEPTPRIPVTQPATAPATGPATTQAAKPPPKTYMEVVLASHPSFPTTQPLGVPLDVREGARIVLTDPIHLDGNGQLWITRADADPVAQVLKRAEKEQAHVVPERVVFAHRAPDAKGVWHPQLVCLRPGGGYELVSAAGRQDMGNSHDYDWSRAFSWNSDKISAIVVPTAGGVSVIRPDRRPMELHHAFYPPEQRPENFTATQVLLDWRGLLAWMPWEHGRPGSPGAARFIDDQWHALDESADWPQRLLHLIPLLDGGVIRLSSEEHDEYVDLSLALLDPPQVDEAKVTALVRQLSHDDPQMRDAAFNELTRYGQGIWPLLERLLPDQLPESQIRIEQLLAAKLEPTLGGMRVMPGRVRVLTRSRGGAALLHAHGGVEVPPATDDEEPRVVAPACVAIIPGKSVMLAPADLFTDLDPEKVRIDIVSGEILVTDDVHGPRWWLSNHYSEPLLRKPEREFSQVIGQDARGRWLFRKATGDRADPPTLVLDPTLPDPTPRLPVWRFQVPDGDVGWTNEGWPAIRRGGGWVLGASDWRPLDPKKEKMILEDEAPATVEPATQAATVPTTSPTTAESSPPILVDKDGTRYYDGLETLHVVKPDGTSLTWPLPDNTVGSGIVWLVRAGDDRLFLFNEPGRVVRIKPTPDGPEPFEVEATFTRRIPSTDNTQRLWVDPAGRIVIAHDIDTLSIMFPKGIIPPDIARKIPASELNEAEGEE